MEEEEKSINDIVSLEDSPWLHPPDSFSLALTGKVFNLLISDEN